MENEIMSFIGNITFKQRDITSKLFVRGKLDPHWKVIGEIYSLSHAEAEIFYVHIGGRIDQQRTCKALEITPLVFKIHLDNIYSKFGLDDAPEEEKQLKLYQIIDDNFEEKERQEEELEDISGEETKGVKTVPIAVDFGVGATLLRHTFSIMVAKLIDSLKKLEKPKLIIFNSYRRIVMWGEPGVGKTFISNSICHDKSNSALKANRESSFSLDNFKPYTCDSRYFSPSLLKWEMNCSTVDFRNYGLNKSELYTPTQEQAAREWLVRLYKLTEQEDYPCYSLLPSIHRQSRQFGREWDSSIVDIFNNIQLKSIRHISSGQKISNIVSWLRQSIFLALWTLSKEIKPPDSFLYQFCDRTKELAREKRTLVSEKTIEHYLKQLLILSEQENREIKSWRQLWKYVQLSSLWTLNDKDCIDLNQINQEALTDSNLNWALQYIDRSLPYDLKMINSAIELAQYRKHWVLWKDRINFQLQELDIPSEEASCLLDVSEGTLHTREFKSTWSDRKIVSSCINFAHPIDDKAEQLQSIEQFIEKWDTLNPLTRTYEEFCELFHRTVFTEKDIQPMVAFDSQKVNIQKKQLSEYLVLSTICWNPGQSIQPHTHNGFYDGIFVYKGILTHKIYENNILEVQKLTVGENIVLKEPITHAMNNEDPLEQLITCHLQFFPNKVDESKLIHNNSDLLSTSTT